MATKLKNIQKNNRVQKIEIRQKNNAGRVMVGGNTEVLVGGKPLKGVTSLNLEIQAGGLAKVTMTMLGDVSVKGKLKGNQYVIGQFGPVSIDKPKKSLKQKLSELLSSVKKSLTSPTNQIHKG